VATHLWLCTALWLPTQALAQASPPADRLRLAQVEVLDQIVLPVALPAGHRLREVSGLAWDAVANELLTVSDRGVVARWRLDIEHRRLVSAWPTHAARLNHAARVNGESIDVMPAAPGGPPARLVVADERRHELLFADSRGTVVEAAPLPAVLKDATARDEKDGVEAIAWHPRHGVMAVRQQPLPTDARSGLHRLLAADGRSWAWRAATAPDGRPSRVKAMHRLDDRRLLVLEKLRTGTRHQTLLREIDLVACAAAAPCDAPAVAIDAAALQADDHFEGLACIDADLCLIASDDGGRGEPRTVLALLWLGRTAASAVTP